MAIEIINDSNEKFDISINNGDLRVLNEIVTDWKFKDKAKALRFALAVLQITGPGNLYQSKDGDMRSLVPTDQITKSSGEGEVNREQENGKTSE